MGRRAISHLGPAILVLALALTYAGAASAQRPPAPTEIPDGAWLATMIEGQPTDPEVRSTLRVDGGLVRGMAGCNRYSGSIGRTDGGIRVAEVASTRMACLPAWDRQEQRFFSAIGRADRLVVRGDRLLLLDKDGASLVTFAPTDRD